MIKNIFELAKMLDVHVETHDTPMSVARAVNARCAEVMYSGSTVELTPIDRRGREMTSNCPFLYIDGLRASVGEGFDERRSANIFFPFDTEEWIDTLDYVQRQR
jgi:hypothetical protein